MKLIWGQVNIYSIVRRLRGLSILAQTDGQTVTAATIGNHLKPFRRRTKEIDFISTLAPWRFDLNLHAASRFSLVFSPSFAVSFLAKGPLQLSVAFAGQSEKCIKDMTCRNSIMRTGVDELGRIELPRLNVGNANAAPAPWSMQLFV